MSSQEVFNLDDPVIIKPNYGNKLHVGKFGYVIKTLDRAYMIKFPKVPDSIYVGAEHIRRATNKEVYEYYNY